MASEQDTSDRNKRWQRKPCRCEENRNEYTFEIYSTFATGLTTTCPREHSRRPDTDVNEHSRRPDTDVNEYRGYSAALQTEAREREARETEDVLGQNSCQYMGDTAHYDHCVCGM